MLLTLLLVIVVVTLMIAVNALYVAGEFSVVSARKSRITQAANQGSRLAQVLLPVVEDHHKLDNYIAASQVGITLSSIVLGIYGQQQIAPLLVPLLAQIPFLSAEAAAAGTAATLVLILLTTLQVVLGELVPKSLALQYPERVALATALPMRWSADIILRPLIILLNGSGALILRLLGVRYGGGHSHVHSPEEIQFLVEQSHAGGLLKAEEHRLLNNVFRFGDTKVGEVVIPRTQMTALPAHFTVAEALRLAATSNMTRIPVYDGDIDQIIGFVHLKDLFKSYYKIPTAGIRDIVRDVTFVPETMPVDELWNTLNREQHYLAIVFDEYGGTLGMVTREDLVEEIFGEVEDEFDPDSIPLIRAVGERVFLIRGDAAVSMVNSRFNLELPEGMAYTIGGLLPNLMGRFPEAGEEIDIAGVRLMAHTVRERVVERVQLTLKQKRQLADEELT